MKSTPFLVCSVIFLSIACKKQKVVPPPKVPVQKQAVYHVFAAKDYGAPVYQHIQVSLRLQVRIINYKNGNMRLLWDSVFSTRKLTEFPGYSNKLVLKKIFPVMDSHEKLNASYSVSYNDEGNIWQEGFSDEAGPGSTDIFIEADM